MGGRSSTPLLIVEHDEALLDLIATWLHDEGYDIVTCSRYEDARGYLARQTPAGLITDVRLGAYNGLQLAMLLHDRRPELPIVVISASMDSPARNETERLGGAFLVKPIERHDFIAALGGARRPAGELS